MKTIVPLTAPPNSREWKKLYTLLAACPESAQQATVIFNPANGPGPDKPWEDRKHWLGLMAKFNALGVKIALHVPVQIAEPNGHRYDLTRRTPKDMREDIRIWRTRYLEHLGSPAVRWWLDFHPCSEESLAWPEVVELYRWLNVERVIANVRTVPTANFARNCPAGALCVHAGNGWPPMTEPTLGGKPTAILACGAPGLQPGVKRHATYLYATPAESNGGTYNAVSPHLSRILGLNV